MRWHLITATVGALAFGMPALAKDFTPPEGCETFLTVQSKQCSVSILWRCDITPGSHWEATFGLDGLESVVSYSSSYQWLDAIYNWDSSREELAPPEADPIDFDALLETGIDTYDFIMNRSEPGASYSLRAVGADQLTGRTVEIDGYPMEVVQTQLRLLREDGTEDYRAEGVQFLSRDMRLFFLGPDRVTTPDGGTTDYDGSPVDIIQPDEPGFGATTPIYECKQQDA